MTIVLTLMVRDEADIIAAMIEHHLAQGVDLIIATDNASQDGTREILAQYAELGVLELHDDPRLTKQQSEVVTGMARRAFTEHGADWVINADADEFWFASTPGRTLAEALAAVPDAVRSFRVPVQNLLGRPLESGSAVLNHRWRDERGLDALAPLGLHAQPEPDAVHRGDAEVQVVQGNHWTSLPLSDPAEVPPEARLEVLHLPWRGWDRYRHRVEVTAAAYAASGRSPSPRHHGLRDARFLEREVLRAFFAARHPEASTEADAPPGFVRENRLAEELTTIEPRLPQLLTAALTPPVPLPDEAEQRERHRLLGPVHAELEELRAEYRYRDQDFYQQVALREQAEERHSELTEQLEQTQREAAQEVATLQAELAAAQQARASAQTTVDQLNTYLANIVAHPGNRMALSLFTPKHGRRAQFGSLGRRLRALFDRAR